jgi:hypothetical protein
MLMRFSPVLMALCLAGGCGGKADKPAKPAGGQQAVNVADLASQSPAAVNAGAAQPPPPGSTGDTPTDASMPDVDPATRAAIQKYIANKGAPPRSWVDLTSEKGYLEKIPVGKDGKPVSFDKVMAKLNIKQP